jgi:Xaa-Pro aminopeptidase
MMMDKRAEMKQRVAALRERLTALGVQGMVVPHEDEYQNEFIPAHAERLAWLTGFAGSAGVAVVLAEKAALFVDGRYDLQAGQQVDRDIFEVHNIADKRAHEWAAEHVAQGGVIAYDPWLHPLAFRDLWQRRLAPAGGALRPLAANPVDALWADRPAPPAGKALPHPLDYAGQPASEKLAVIAQTLRAAGARAALVTALDSVAWLFNIRGGDGPFTPVVEARALVMADGTARLYIAPGKRGEGLAAHLGEAVALRAPEQLAGDLAAVAAGQPIMADPSMIPLALAQAIEDAGGRILPADDPCLLPRALKNPVELEGMRRAHRRDGVALTRFLAWLDQRMAGNGVDELAAADELERFRSQGEHFRGLSFDTIAGSGPNGAVIHYRATPETNRVLGEGELFLVDSGGQYLDGTTDVTRTMAIGTPTAEQRDRFTRVLKGHIALGAARFPKGTSGSHLDSLARHALWAAGLDYDHGTGHGVGSYLNVHEGPQRISKRGGDVALSPGMVISNEPGYYLPGAFGIRIESLVAVREEPVAEGARPFYSFETLTLAPIDRRLLAVDMLSGDERDWLNAYHARVWDEISPSLDDATKDWLRKATQPL